MNPPASNVAAMRSYIRQKEEGGSKDNLTLKLCVEYFGYGSFDGVIRNNVKHISVFVPEESRLVNRITMSATVSFMEVVSSIGGTLGLFAGFSIISMAELMYWLVKITVAKIQRARRASLLRMQMS